MRAPTLLQPVLVNEICVPAEMFCRSRKTNCLVPLLPLVSLAKAENCTSPALRLLDVGEAVKLGVTVKLGVALKGGLAVKLAVTVGEAVLE